MRKSNFKKLFYDLLKEGRSLKTGASGFSMYPTIKSKDKILIKPLSFKEAKVGDILAFKQKNLEALVVAHRLIKKRKNYFLTKGDRHKKGDFDRPVIKKEIVGKVVALERAGKTYNLENPFLNRFLAFISLNFPFVLRLYGTIIWHQEKGFFNPFRVLKKMKKRMLKG